MTTGSNVKDGSAKKKTWARGRKRRLMPKDSNAPKGPFTGYMMFVNEQREALKQTDSKICFQEFNKSMAQKWAQLDVDEKKKYLDAAEADKARFEQEMVEYKKTETYKTFIENHLKGEIEEKRKKKEIISKEKEVKRQQQSEKVVIANGFLEIPIFTEEFLNQNKTREGELRQLRKSTTDYEEQIVILQKHIQNMRDAVDKLKEDMKQQETKNASLNQHLRTLRKSLTHSFAGVAIPGSSLKPTEGTIDAFLAQLHSAVTSHPQQHNKLAQNVKQIVNTLANTL